MNKGQIEMIGLVIIVILLIIGLVFYVKFGVLRRETVPESTLEEQISAINLMGAIFNMEVCEENPTKIEELLVNCFEDQSTEFCNEEDSCVYAKGEINKIIDSINLKNYKKYSISVEKGENTVEIKGDCATGILASTTVVTPEGDYYTAKFRVC